MQIGIIVAVTEELNSFLEAKYKVKEKIINNRKVYLSKIGKHKIYITASGYGKIDAAAATQFLITKFNCELIINYGVTGALVESLNVSDLFLVEKAINYDFDISQIENVKKHQYLGFDDEYIPLDKNYIKTASSIFFDLKNAIIASGDRFIDQLDEKIDMAKSLNCNICDMEIAAIAKICATANIPCLSIKCISDSLEGSGKDYHENVANSAKKAFDIIEKLILKM